MTGAAFAVMDDQSEFDFVAGFEVGPGVFALGALALLVVRVALGFVSVVLSAQLSVDVVTDIRTDLTAAYLRADWASQHGERGGQLQHLLTNFAQQGAYLIGGFAAAVVAAFTLAALLAVAVFVDLTASLVVVVAVLLLGWRWCLCAMR